MRGTRGWLRSPLRAEEAVRSCAAEDNVQRIARKGVRLDRQPGCKIGCGLEDVPLAGLSIQPEVKVIRAHSARP